MFASPGGKKIRVGGFHYGSLEKPKIEVTHQATGHSGTKKAVKYVFDRQNIWKARFAPREPGRWTYDYVFTNTQGGKATGSGRFECVVDPARRHPGFVRQHPANPHRWVFDDGSPYFPIGLQDGAFDNQGVGSVLAQMAIDGGFRTDRKGRPELPPGDPYKIAPPKHVTGEEYFATYGKAGFKLFRFSQQNFSLPLYTNLDRYLVQEGVMVDELLTCVRRHGFRVFYGLFGYQPVFAEHPENAEGMAKVKRFVKYSVDRWGRMSTSGSSSTSRRPTPGGTKSSRRTSARWTPTGIRSPRAGSGPSCPESTSTPRTGTPGFATSWAATGRPPSTPNVGKSSTSRSSSANTATTPQRRN